MINWLRKRKLKKLKQELFNLEWSFPAKTYSFDESQFVMLGRQRRLEHIKGQIEELESA